MQPRILKQESETIAPPYLDSLYQFALLLTGQRHHAEDLVYETYLRARHIHEPFEYEHHYKAWLFTTMHKIFMNDYHRGAREVADPHTEDGEESAYEQPPDRGIFQVVTEKALNELPESLKAVIVLKDVLGFDYQDIAKILGCPVGMLISRLWKGRNLLKKSLKDYCTGSVRPPVRREAI